MRRFAEPWVFCLLVFAACGGNREPPETSSEGWAVLFDGVGLGQWEVTNFGGEGKASVDEDRLVLNWGNDLTGVTWSGTLPAGDYELALEAMRVQGNDFFCGLTFPVADSHCSLIVGGWGGGTVGLSSIDGRDASQNETTRLMTFENGRWYTIRVQVAEDRIAAWIDEAIVVDVPTAGKRFDVRPELRLSRPLGLATWRTTAAYRNIRMRSVR